MFSLLNILDGVTFLCGNLKQYIANADVCTVGTIDARNIGRKLRVH